MAWEYFLKLEKNGIDKYVDGYIRDKILIPQTLWKISHPCIKPHKVKHSKGSKGSLLFEIVKFVDVLKPFNPYWHCEQVWCPPITRNNAVAKSNAWLSPPGNLAGQAWNYQLQMIDKTLIRRATGGGMLDDGSSNCKGNWYTKSQSIFDLSLRNPFCLTAFSKQHFVV